MRTQLRRKLVECDRRKRRSGNPADLRSARTSLPIAYNIVATGQRLRGGYRFASGAASTALQAAGNCASVIGGFGFGGSFGGFGCSTASENQ